MRSHISALPPKACSKRSDIRGVTAPIGTFLSKTMRNAVTLGVGQNRLDLILGDLELFGNFGNPYPIIEIVDNRAHGHPSTLKHGSAALHTRLGFHQGAFGPVDSVVGNYSDLPLR